MKILNLTLKKKWFDMIASGEKKEEYREVKDYWRTRLSDKHNLIDGGVAYLFKSFDAVCFTNGYSKNSPKITVKWEGIKKDVGVQKWGAEAQTVYYVIKLGQRIQ